MIHIPKLIFNICALTLFIILLSSAHHYYKESKTPTIDARGTVVNVEQITQEDEDDTHIDYKLEVEYEVDDIYYSNTIYETQPFQKDNKLT